METGKDATGKAHPFNQVGFPLLKIPAPHQRGKKFDD